MKLRLENSNNGSSTGKSAASPSAVPMAAPSVAPNSARFSLRKRSFRTDANTVNMASYNSDFLSGLFADVAKANVLSELAIPQQHTRERPAVVAKRSCALISADVASSTPALSLPSSGAVSTVTPSPTSPASVSHRDAVPLPSSKRSRRSLHPRIGNRSRLSANRQSNLRKRTSFLKSRQSTRNLHSLCGQSLSSVVVDAAAPCAASAVVDETGPRIPPIGNRPDRSHRSNTAINANANATLERHNSLAYQLQCVSDSDAQTQPSASTVASGRAAAAVDVVEMAFPHLPATVSETSCVPRRHSLAMKSPSSNADSDPKESFGWFVDLDETPDQPAALTATSSSGPTNDLAFQAPTAPKRVNDEAELEWAKAADTVDDVLGDFF